MTTSRIVFDIQESEKAANMTRRAYYGYERYKNTLLFAALALIVSGCFSQTPSDKQRGREQNPQPETEVVPQEQPSSEGQGQPLSRLEEFAKQEFNGSDLKLGRTLDDNAAYTRYYITYQSGELTISGIMNVPKGKGPFPLLVLNHGYIDPDVYTNGRGLKREQDYLARRGFAVLHTDYRKHAESDPDPDEREIYDGVMAYAMDSLNAINAVRAAEIGNIDSSKVGMVGHSMGGGVTMLAASTHPEMIDAAVLYAPISGDAWKNFERWRAKDPDSGPTFDHFGRYEENPETWEALSIEHYFRNIGDPILLFHGKRDRDVPYEWSTETEAALRSVG